ncbi:hypothetical protein SAMN04488109_3660 [Chryseolinea serpens]|uniref:PH domain-containing protein n=1 Tax=Chryseolinea serpens TaxID=947013 RepID=A0A1M5RZ83_9BACT|nr:hypothetical protein [Chryseolinea serpens]SHH31484.1 hypothetical protein SAMN04488109_3660 [Chryseolinea serpens]
MKRLSATNTINGLVPPILLLLGLTFYVVKVDHPTTISHFGVVFSVYVVLLAWVYSVSKRVFDLYYDAQFLYLKGVLRSFKVPLKIVRKIQFTNTMVPAFGIPRGYRIEFDPSANIDDQGIWLMAGSKKVEEFAETVRKVNERVVVRHSSLFEHIS